MLVQTSAQILKFIYLHLFTELFHKDFPAIVLRDTDGCAQLSTCGKQL